MIFDVPPEKKSQVVRSEDCGRHETDPSCRPNGFRASDLNTGAQEQQNKIERHRVEASRPGGSLNASTFEHLTQ